MPARDPGPCHRTERTASPPADPRLRELPSRRPHSRLLGEGHAKPAASRAEASCGLNRDFHPAIGRSPPSLLLAPGGIDLLGSPSPLHESHSRSQRQHLPGRSARRGRRPRGDLKDTVAETSPSRLRWRQRDPYPPSARTVPAEPHLPRVHRFVTSLRAADPILTTHTGRAAGI